MTIEIKNYEESFIDAQIELVKEATKDWKFFNYPNKDQLKQNYSAETFTPETRYYAFEENKLVGFLSSAYGNEEGTANLQFPFVKEGYEHLREILMDNAFDTFKQNGVEAITTNVQSFWTGAKETLTSFEFEKNSVAGVQLITQTENYDYSDFTPQATYAEVDPETDKEELIRVFQTEMTQTAEQIGAIIDGWKESENILMNTISKDESGRIITHSMVVKNQNNPDLAQMTHISIYDHEYKERRSEQLKVMLQQLKEKGYKTVLLFAVPNEEIETYPTDEFTVNKIVQYKKALTPLQSA